MNTPNSSAVASGAAKVRFCEYYESKLTEYDLMTVLKNELTRKGIENYKNIEEYLSLNRDKYLEYQENMR